MDKIAKAFEHVGNMIADSKAKYKHLDEVAQCAMASGSPDVKRRAHKQIANSLHISGGLTPDQRLVLTPVSRALNEGRI